MDSMGILCKRLHIEYMWILCKEDHTWYGIIGDFVYHNSYVLLIQWQFCVLEITRDIDSMWISCTIDYTWY
jgi:hypothetical protein